MTVQGYNDLSHPYFQRKLVVAQIPATGDPGRLQVKVYPGGSTPAPDSQAALQRDIMGLYGVR